MTVAIARTNAIAEDFHDLLVAALPALRQQAMALTRNRSEADDLVQAAVTSALAAKASFEPGTNFRAWMTRILRNRFRSNMRARRETVEIDDAPAAAFARSGRQEERIEIAELRRHLARLPADQRLALLMITVQQKSYEEVSSELGVAVGTLKCRVFRARRQLQAWMLGEEAVPAQTRKPAVRPSVSDGRARARARAAAVELR
ncbi:sigma-70 family RNA polymerase sigma factor [Leptolyngbya sp. 15MV]|nr:sigma-70 family RNA polymerase sigma factor [Leptolyngbya sp. 15MV]